jgi:small subunit ribosomal protein S3Ae
MPRRRTVRRKLKKKSFTIVAPHSLGGVELQDFVADDPERVIGRVCRPLLYDITEDLQHQNIILKLKIVGVEGKRAQTIFAGYKYVREYLRALVIRGTSFVEVIKEVETADGYRYRVTVGIFTIRRINPSRMRAIRKRAFEVLERKSGDLDHDSFIKEMLFEKVASEIYKSARKICPLRHVGILKVKLLSVPEAKREVIYEGVSVSSGEGQEA